MRLFVKRGKFLKITSGATLLAVAPTLALQAQGEVNEETIKATKPVIEKLLGKNPFLKIFCGVSLVVILVLLCKTVSFRSGKSPTIKPGLQNTGDENRNSNLSNFGKKDKKRDFSVKENEIKNEVNAVQKNDNKSAHKIDFATGSIASGNKVLDNAAKNLEKNKPKKSEKYNISVKENKKIGSKKVENDINVKESKENNILKNEKVSMPEKNKKPSNERIVEKIFEPLNRENYCSNQYDDETELILNNVNKIFFILNFKNEIRSYNTKLKVLEDKKAQLGKEFKESNGCDGKTFFNNIKKTIKEKMSSKDVKEAQRIAIRIAKGEVKNIENMNEEDFKKLKEKINKYVSHVKEKKKLKEEIGDLEKKFSTLVKESKIEDIVKARELFFKLKKDYTDLVRRKSEEKVRHSTGVPYIIYVPEFLELDGNASDDEIVSRFKNWVGYACKWAEEIKKKYDEDYHLRRYSEFKEDCIATVNGSMDFYQFFWAARRYDPKFKEALNKKKKEVLASMNEKESNNNFNVENQINSD